MTQKAVVLDRDGVINDNRRFVNKPADLVLYDYTPQAIRMLNGAGFLVLVATNQGGVGLGYLSETDLFDIHQTMVTQLSDAGARIDEVLACTHAPSAGCHCRKPNPGMLLTFRKKYDLNPERSFMIGDRETDVEAGRRADFKTIYLGHEKTLADHRSENLLEAASWIVSL